MKNKTNFLKLLSHNDMKVVEEVLKSLQNDQETRGNKNSNKIEDKNKGRSISNTNQNILNKRSEAADGVSHYHENINSLHHCSTTEATCEIQVKSHLMEASTSAKITENSYTTQTSKINAEHNFIKKYDMVKKTEATCKINVRSHLLKACSSASISDNACPPQTSQINAKYEMVKETEAACEINVQSHLLKTSSSASISDDSCSSQTSQINAKFDFIKKYDIVKETEQSSNAIKYIMERAEQTISIQDVIKQEILETSSTKRAEQFKRYHFRKELDYKIKSQQIMSQLIGNTITFSDKKEKGKERNTQQPSNKTKKSSIKDKSHIMHNTSGNKYVKWNQKDFGSSYNTIFQHKNINYRKNKNIDQATIEKNRREFTFGNTSYKANYMNTSKKTLLQSTMIQNEPIVKPNQFYKSEIKMNEGSNSQLNELEISNINNSAANQLDELETTQNSSNSQNHEWGGINTSNYATNQLYGLQTATNDCTAKQHNYSETNASASANNQLYGLGINTQNCSNSQNYGLGINTQNFFNSQSYEWGINKSNCATKQLHGLQTTTNASAIKQHNYSETNASVSAKNQLYGLGINKNFSISQNFKWGMNTSNCAPNQLHGWQTTTNACPVKQHYASETTKNDCANKLLNGSGISEQNCSISQNYGWEMNTSNSAPNQLHRWQTTTNACAVNQHKSSETIKNDCTNKLLDGSGISAQNCSISQNYGWGMNTSNCATNQLHGWRNTTRDCARKKTEIKTYNHTNKQLYEMGINTHNIANNQLSGYGINRNECSTKQQSSLHIRSNNGAIYNQYTNKGNTNNITTPIISKGKIINNTSSIKNQEMGKPLTGRLKRTQQQTSVEQEREYSKKIMLQRNQTANNKIIRSEDNNCFTNIHTTEKLQLSCSKTTVHKYKQESGNEKIDNSFGSDYCFLPGNDNQENLSHQKIGQQPHVLPTLSKREEMDQKPSSLEKPTLLNIKNTMQSTEKTLALMIKGNKSVHQQMLPQKQSFQSNKGCETTVTNHSFQNKSLNRISESSITHPSHNSSSSLIQYKILKDQNTDVLCYKIGNNFYYRTMKEIIMRDIENRRDQSSRSTRNEHNLESMNTCKQPNQCLTGEMNEANIINSTELKNLVDNDTDINNPSKNYRNAENANYNNLAGEFYILNGISQQGSNDIKKTSYMPKSEQYQWAGSSNMANINNTINQQGSNDTKKRCYIPKPEQYQHDGSSNIGTTETNFNIQNNNSNQNLNWNLNGSVFNRQPDNNI